VHDFAADIDGRTEGFKSNLDNVDGAHYSSAKATRFE
jgi:hypothetical protein